jgi:hypothetical protein
MTGDRAHVERLADRLAAAGPLLGTAGPETVAATLGWRTVGAFGGNEILVDTGVPGGENVALLFTTADGRRVFTGARVTRARGASAEAGCPGGALAPPRAGGQRLTPEQERAGEDQSRPRLPGAQNGLVISALRGHERSVLRWRPTAWQVRASPAM